MAISRAQLLKELLPGLNALFGLEYAKYGEEHKEIYETESSERSFEEEIDWYPWLDINSLDFDICKIV